MHSILHLQTAVETLLNDSAVELSRAARRRLVFFVLGVLLAGTLVLRRVATTHSHIALGTSRAASHERRLRRALRRGLRAEDVLGLEQFRFEEVLERLTDGQGVLAALAPGALKVVPFKQTADRILSLAEFLELVAGHAELLAAITAVRHVHVEESITRYVVSLLRHTRASSRLALGGSPRSGIALLSLAKARALVEGREFVVPDDEQALAGPVLAHRLILAPEARATGVTADELVAEALAGTPVPV